MLVGRRAMLNRPTAKPTLPKCKSGNSPRGDEPSAKWTELEVRTEGKPIVDASANQEVLVPKLGKHRAQEETTLQTKSGSIEDYQGSADRT